MFINWCEMIKLKILLVCLIIWLFLKVDFLLICLYIIVGLNFIFCNYELLVNDFNIVKIGNYKNIRLFWYKIEWLNWLKFEGLFYLIYLVYFVNILYSLIFLFVVKLVIWFNFLRILIGFLLVLMNSFLINLRNIKMLF